MLFLMLIFSFSGIPKTRNLYQEIKNRIRRFIQKAQLKADYRFAVLTYGNRKCSAVEIWDDVSRKAGSKFDYINTIKMVDNWLPNFDMN